MDQKNTPKANDKDFIGKDSSGKDSLGKEPLDQEFERQGGEGGLDKKHAGTHGNDKDLRAGNPSVNNTYSDVDKETSQR